MMPCGVVRAESSSTLSETRKEAAILPVEWKWPLSPPFAVKSFGTEDRETSYPIMPQPTVYDYILFRGSDIKDIRVVNNVVIPNDPAIMQMHMPQQGGFPNQGFPPMQHGGVPAMGNFGPFGPMAAAMGGQNMPQQQQAQSPIQSQHQGNNNNLAPGSGSGQKNKKSSELSNEKTSEKPSEKTSKSTTLRKQSNKSQGVPRFLLKLSFLARSLPETAL